MAFWLVLTPLIFAAVAFALPSERWRPWLLPIAAVGHLVLVVAALCSDSVNALGNWLVLDALGKIFLGFLSVLFTLCSLYTASYLNRSHERSNRVFCTCQL